MEYIKNIKHLCVVFRIKNCPSEDVMFKHIQKTKTKQDDLEIKNQKHVF